MEMGYLTGKVASITRMVFHLPPRKRRKNAIPIVLEKQLNAQ